MLRSTHLFGVWDVMTRAPSQWFGGLGAVAVAALLFVVPAPGRAETTLIIEMPTVDVCDEIAARAPPRVSQRSLSLGGVKLRPETLFKTLCARLRDDMIAAAEARFEDVTQIQATQGRILAAVEGAQREIYASFLSWVAEVARARLPVEVQAQYADDAQTMALDWLARPENEITTYVHAYIHEGSPVLAALFKDYMSGASAEIVTGLKGIWDKAQEKLTRFRSAVGEVEPGSTEWADTLKDYGFSGSYVDRFKGYEERFNRLDRDYNVIAAGKIVIDAFQTDVPDQKIQGLFALLENLGSTASNSRIPIVSFFGDVVQAYGRVGREMLDQVYALEEKLRAREGYCIGLATHAGRDPREAPFIAVAGDGVRACPAATQGLLKDVFVQAQPDDASQLYFWLGDKFVKGVPGNGGVAAVRVANGLIARAGVIGVPAYIGKSNDVATIAMVYNTPYRGGEDGKDRPHGVTGLIAEAEEAIATILEQTKRLRSAVDIGAGCEVGDMDDYLKDTGLRPDAFPFDDADKLQRLVIGYAAGFVDKHRPGISGAARRSRPYEIYSEIWRKIRDISLFSLPVAVRDAARLGVRCPRCAGARIDVSVEGGEELPGCRVETADDKGNATIFVASPDGTPVSVRLSATAEGKSSETLTVDKRVVTFGEAPYVTSFSLTLPVLLEPEEKQPETGPEPDVDVDKLLEVMAKLADAADGRAATTLAACQEAGNQAEAQARVLTALEQYAEQLADRVAALPPLPDAGVPTAERAATLRRDAEAAGEKVVAAKQAAEREAEAACSVAEAVEAGTAAPDTPTAIQRAKGAGAAAAEQSRLSGEALARAQTAAREAATLTGGAADTQAAEIKKIASEIEALAATVANTTQVLQAARERLAVAEVDRGSLDTIAARAAARHGDLGQAADRLVDAAARQSVLDAAGSLLGRTMAAVRRPAACLTTSAAAVDAAEGRAQALEARVASITDAVAAAREAAQPQATGDSVGEDVAMARAAADTAEIFAEAADVAATNTQRCVELAEAAAASGAERIARAAAVAIDTCAFDEARDAIANLPEGARRAALAAQLAEADTRESATRAQFQEAKALFDAGRLAESRATLQSARQNTRCDKHRNSIDAALVKVAEREREIIAALGRARTALKRCDFDAAGAELAIIPEGQDRSDLNQRIGAARNHEERTRSLFDTAKVLYDQNRLNQSLDKLYTARNHTRCDSNRGKIDAAIAKVNQRKEEAARQAREQAAQREAEANQSCASQYRGSVADANGQCVCPSGTSWSDAQRACVGASAGGGACDQIQQKAMAYGQRLQGYQGQFMSAGSEAAQQQLACAMLGDSRQLLNILIEGERAGCPTQGNFAASLRQIEQVYGQFCPGGGVYQGDDDVPCADGLFGQGECN